MKPTLVAIVGGGSAGLIVALVLSLFLPSTFAGVGTGAILGGGCALLGEMAGTLAVLRWWRW